MQLCQCADLVIEITGNLGQDDSYYRLDYYPPYGNPAPNTTIASRDIGDRIQFSHTLPGTRYNFWLYYTNATHHDWLTWTVSITTGEANFELRKKSNLSNGFISTHDFFHFCTWNAIFSILCTILCTRHFIKSWFMHSLSNNTVYKETLFQCVCQIKLTLMRLYIWL